jgi:hypothetical protein
MQLLKCAGYAGVATGSILVYAYIPMYYTKNRGFENEGFVVEILLPGRVCWREAFSRCQCHIAQNGGEFF